MGKFLFNNKLVLKPGYCYSIYEWDGWRHYEIVSKYRMMWNGKLRTKYTIRIIMLKNNKVVTIPYVTKEFIKDSFRDKKYKRVDKSIIAKALLQI